LRPAFDEASRRLLTQGDDGYERVWKVDGWQQESARKLDIDVSAFAFSPGANVSVTINKDGELDLMDWGNPARRRRGLGSREMVSLSFSPDGRLLAGASEKGILELFDVETLHSVAKLRAVLLGLHSACFSPDGRRLATGSDGKEAMKLWDVDSHEVVATLAGQGSLFYNAAWSRDGNTIGARNLKGVLHLWRAPSWEDIAAKEGTK
jgi:WD40 repeat protein